jgi:hypothetical protein
MAKSQEELTCWDILNISLIMVMARLRLEAVLSMLAKQTMGLAFRVMPEIRWRRCPDAVRLRNNVGLRGIA